MEELQNEEIVEQSTEDRRWCVYMHINKENGKVYIGQTRQDVHRRWRNGDGYQKYQAIRRAFDKYGWDNFEHIIICDHLNLCEANFLECFLIDCFNARNPNFGYNISGGGDNSGERNPNYGVPVSDEVKKLISQKAIERYRNPEAREKLSKALKGRQISEEQRRLISLSRTGQCLGADNPNYGNGRPIVQLNLNYQIIAEYPAICQASKVTGVNDSQIIRCCQRKPRHKTAGGFIWMYKEDYEKQLKKLNNND